MSLIQKLRSTGRSAHVPRSIESATHLWLVILGLMLVPVSLRGQLAPEWTSSTPLGTAFAAGLQGLYVDPDGVSYMTGIGGPSPNTDVINGFFCARWFNALVTVLGQTATRTVQA